MPVDKQLTALQSQAAPLAYTVPGNAEILLKAVNANFTDSGAAGDWLPAVVLLSDSGHVIARAVDPGSPVTAGDDAEVSWFPGVKPSGAAGTLPYLNQSALAQGTQVAKTITSGVITAVAWDLFFSGPGYGAMFGVAPSTSNPVTFAKFATVTCTLVVNWPAGNYDRYSEFTIGNQSTVEYIASPRIRHATSPDGDRQTLCAVIAGDPFNPTTITTRVFQASGVNKAITAGVSFYSIPYGVAPYVVP